MQTWTIKGKTYNHEQLMELKKQGLDPHKDEITMVFVTPHKGETKAQEKARKVSARGAADEAAKVADEKAKLAAEKGASDRQKEEAQKAEATEDNPTDGAKDELTEEECKKFLAERNIDVPDGESLENLRKSVASIVSKESPEELSGKKEETKEEEFERLKKAKAWLRAETKERYNELKKELAV